MMRRLSAVAFGLVTLILVLAGDVDARRRWDIGAHGGPNVAGIYGTDADSLGAESRTGIALGVWGTNWLSDNVGLRLEVMYSQKGATRGRGDEEVTAKLDYIDIPLLVVFSRELTPGALFVDMHAGPALSLQVSAEFDSAGSVVRDLDAITTNWDFGGVIGVGFALRAAQRLDVTLDLRYTVSFVSIDDRPTDFDFRNNAFSLLLGIQSRLGYW